MKKSDYTGLKEVFTFSFLQDLKSAAFRYSLAIISVIIIVGIPVIGYIANKQNGDVGRTQIERLNCVNDTEFDFAFDKILSGDRYEGLEVSKSKFDEFEQLVTKMEEDPDSNSVVAKITYEEGLFYITFVKSVSSDFSDEDYDQMITDFQEGFEREKINAVGVSKEQLELVQMPVEYGVKVAQTDNDGKTIIADENQNKNKEITFSEYTILLGAIIVVMMIVNIAGGKISNQIVTEKTTKVIEYLMINVRPMALILGKILSELLIVAIEIFVMTVAFIIGSSISGSLFGKADFTDDNSIMVFLRELSELSPIKAILCLLVIIMGVLFFAILAGLAGASVSKMDELAEGMKMYQFVLLVGTYAGIGLCIAQMSTKVSSTVVSAVCMIPFSTPFVLPGNLILGKVGVATAVAGLAILTIVTVLMYVFTSRVYEAMIFYNGKVLKFKDIVGIAKRRGI